MMFPTQSALSPRDASQLLRCLVPQPPQSPPGSPKSPSSPPHSARRPQPRCSPLCVFHACGRFAVSDALGPANYGAGHSRRPRDRNDLRPQRSYPRKCRLRRRLTMLGSDGLEEVNYRHVVLEVVRCNLAEDVVRRQVAQNASCSQCQRD